MGENEKFRGNDGKRVIGNFCVQLYTFSISLVFISVGAKIPTND